MPEIIIGIHGLGNKPPPKTLKAWWKLSLREGLKQIGAADTFFDFELAYWADYMYSTPLNRRIKDADHPLYIEDPYFPAPQGVEPEKPSELRQKILDYVDGQLNKLFLNENLSINYQSITDFIIHHFFRDLEAYYNDYCVKKTLQACEAKVAIGLHLADVLRKHREKKIMLIAHSMGSIIAYDVLTAYAPEVDIDTLVTIGSPLGLPVIQRKLMVDNKSGDALNKMLRTPENILQNWYNLSDLKDKISIDYRIGDDFAANSRQVRPADKIVVNNYKFRALQNPHKSFGYLRTLEMATIVRDFLETGRSRPFGGLRKFIAMIIKRGSGD